jgi:hypothetical protein
MSDAALRTDGSLEAQPKMGVRNLHNFGDCPRLSRSSEIVNRQPAPFDDALESADGNGFVAMHGDNDLPTVRVTPFLRAAFLADHREALPSKDADNFLGIADWKPLAHGSASSTTFAPAGTATGEGSNQSSSASLALRMASSSVSPAEAQPGSSGKKPAHRFVSGSYSTTSRSFIGKTIVRPRLPRNPAL